MIITILILSILSLILSILSVWFYLINILNTKILFKHMDETSEQVIQTIKNFIFLSQEEDIEGVDIEKINLKSINPQQMLENVQEAIVERMEEINVLGKEEISLEELFKEVNNVVKNLSPAYELPILSTRLENCSIIVDMRTYGDTISLKFSPEEPEEKEED